MSHTWCEINLSLHITPNKIGDELTTHGYHPRLKTSSTTIAPISHDSLMVPLKGASWVAREVGCRSVETVAQALRYDKHHSAEGFGSPSGH